MREKKILRDGKLIVPLAIVFLFFFLSMCFWYKLSVEQKALDFSQENIMDSTYQAANLISSIVKCEKSVLMMHKGTIEKVVSYDLDSLEYLLSEFSTIHAPEILCIDGKLYPSDHDCYGLNIARQEDKDFGIVNPHISKINGNEVVGLYTKVILSDGKVGFLIREVPIDIFSEVFTLTFYKKQGHSYMMDINGNILDGSDNLEDFILSNNLFFLLNDVKSNKIEDVNRLRQKVMMGESGYAVLDNYNETNLFCYTPINDTPWYMISVNKKSIINEYSQHIINDTSLLIFVCFIMAVVITAMIIVKERNKKRLMMEDNLLVQDMIVASYSQVNCVILGINLDEDSFRVVFDNGLTGIDFTDYRKYSEMISKCLDKIDVRYVDEMRENLSLEGIKERLSNNKINTYMEVMTDAVVGKHWVAIEVIKVKSNDLINRAIASVRIIDGVKEEEEKRMDILKTSLAMAKQANVSKTVFLNNMSHDIRTPLNGILGMAALAKTNMDDKDRIKECLDDISITGNHLLSLINSILDVSRIESGRMTLSCENVNVMNIFNSSVKMLEAEANKKQHTIMVDISNIRHAMVWADPLRISQIIINIVGNAIKYTPNGGKIKISLCENESRDEGYYNYSFICTDNGYGMKEEFIDRIFDPFERADEEYTKEISGTGLGLAIVKNIVEMMDGDITISSEYGKYSTFKVNFSLGHPRMKVDDTGDVDRREDNKKAPNDISVYKEYDFSNKRILLVEDVEMNREIAAEILGLTKVKVDTAENGEIALNMFCEKPDGFYDMILMDIRMPHMDGYEATKAIRALDRSDAMTVPIVAMSANAFLEDRDASIKCGMNDYLLKPIDYSKLLAILTKYMENNDVN